MWRGKGRWTGCLGCGTPDLQFESFAEGFSFTFFVRGIGMPAGIILLKMKAGWRLGKGWYYSHVFLPLKHLPGLAHPKKVPLGGGPMKGAN